MRDATLGGYIEEHERPPAFQGADGHSYTVEIICEGGGAGVEGEWKAYLFFLRWRGGEPVGHVESDYLSEAAAEEDARAVLLQLSLHEVKQILDGLVK